MLLLNDNLAASTTIAAAQRWFGGYDHGIGYDNDRCGGYDHGNGYDHDCCGSTTAVITTLGMVTIAAAMAAIDEPLGVSNRPLPRPPSPRLPGNWGDNCDQVSVR